MKIVNKGEQLLFVSRSGNISKASRICSKIDALEVGQALVISKMEWKSKNDPSNIMYNYVYKLRNSRKLLDRKFTFRTLAKSKGWAILRQK